MSLLGRERELHLFAGRRGVIQLTGEPGIGKTCLLDELCARSAHRTVLRGAATEFEAEIPFAPFADASWFDVAGGDLPGERYRLHRAVGTRLERMADGRPVLLVVDDAHWADPASVELLAHLARRPVRCELLVVVAFRPAQASTRLLRALRGCERVALGPLSRAEAETLLRGVPSWRRDAVYERSGGNPFFLDALVRRSREASAVPDAVIDVLHDELMRLSPEALALARGGAVASEPFAPELAAAGAGLVDPAALAALDELLEAELITSAGPRAFRFRHPIVRQAIYAQAGRGWRLAAHARVAGLLARQGASPPRRAHHLEQCAQPGDREAIAVLATAAGEVVGRAPAAAARWWAAALRLLPDRAPDEERVELLVPMATALGAAGELAAARDALHEVLGLAEDAELRGRLVAFIALIEQLLGHRDTAQALLAETLAAKPDQGSRTATALRIELANERYFAADWAGMRVHAADALRAARALADDPLIAAAAGMLALAEYHVSDVAAARVLLDEAAERLDALSDDALAGRLDAALFTGWAEQCLARWPDVHRHYERALAVGRATGQGYLLVPMTIGRAIARCWQGHLGQAAELADEAIEAAELAGNAQSLTWALTLRTWIATLIGDLGHAVAQAQRARAALQLARGEPARAAETARAAARHSHQAGNAIDAAQAHLLAGRALAAAGRTQDAAVALTAALQQPQARRLHDAAALELRRLGRRVPKQGRRASRPGRGVEALTDREREIAGLIAAGHTNRRIATHLHLSPKTVETHVAHIFAKLGVRSRAAAVSALSQGPPGQGSAALPTLGA